MTLIIVLSSCPDAGSAERIGAALVEEHLAACVNLIPGVTSIFCWKGQVQRDTEHLLVIKTTRDRFAAVRERIVALHSYELPEVIALEPVDALERYTAWVQAATAY